MISDTQDFRIENVLNACEPSDIVPLIFDSPHSGTVFPASFACAATEWQLKVNVDAFVDQLFSGVVACGAGFLEALFPRTFVDANRSEHEIDPDLLAGEWPYPVRQTRKTRAGMGVIRRDIGAGVRMYDRRLTVAEVEWRLQTFHAPYHAALAGLLDRAHARHGAVWHINCHSMKSRGASGNIDEGQLRPDFVISDLDGRTSEPEFVHFLVAFMEGKGYRVGVNSPFRGAEIIHRYGKPGHGRHSVQVEINRALYLDETCYEKSAGFEALRSDLMAMTKAIISYTGDRLATRRG